jgi:hypothetical protein
MSGLPPPAPGIVPVDWAAAASAGQLQSTNMVMGSMIEQGHEQLLALPLMPAHLLQPPPSSMTNAAAMAQFQSVGGGYLASRPSGSGIAYNAPIAQQPPPPPRGPIVPRGMSLPPIDDCGSGDSDGGGPGGGARGGKYVWRSVGLVDQEKAY